VAVLFLHPIFIEVLDELTVRVNYSCDPIRAAGGAVRRSTNEYGHGPSSPSTTFVIVASTIHQCVFEDIIVLREEEFEQQRVPDY